MRKCGDKRFGQRVQNERTVRTLSEKGGGLMWNVSSLGQHGITTEKLTAFQARIDAYNFIIQKPRAARAQNKTITAQLKLEFRAADLLLREGLDRLILQFRADAPIFFSDYQNARLVINDAATRETRKIPTVAIIPSEPAQPEVKPLAA